uniref:UPF0308 protein C9orf21 n=1 Tax=Anthurium amnicola TaxID=1678845 RepID=A0A1D1Y6J2_9ARAE
MALLSPRALLVTSPSPSLLSSSAAAAAAASFPAYTYRPPTSSVSSTRQSGGRGFSTWRRVEGAAPSRLLLRAASSSASPSSVASSADVLRDVAIYSALTGEPVLFGDLWDQNEGMAVVALLRHFGCFCWYDYILLVKSAKFHSH